MFLDSFHGGWLERKPVYCQIDDLASAAILVEALDSYLALDGLEEHLLEKQPGKGPIEKARSMRKHCARILAEAASTISQLPGHTLSDDSLLVMTGAIDPSERAHRIAHRMLLQVGGQNSVTAHDDGGRVT